MTLHEFNGMLNEISYKEGWVFKLYRAYERDGFNFTISCTAQDATKKESAFTIVMNGGFIDSKGFERMDREEAVKFIGHQIMILERHEFEEFFKFQGKCVYDPHPRALTTRGMHESTK